MALLPQRPVVRRAFPLILHLTDPIKCVPSSPSGHHRPHASSAFLLPLLLLHSSSASDPTSASTSSLRALLWNRPRSRRIALLLVLLHRAWGGSLAIPRAKKKAAVEEEVVIREEKMMRRRVGWSWRAALRLRVPFWLECCWWVWLVGLPLLGMSTRTRSMRSLTNFRLSSKVIFTFF